MLLLIKTVGWLLARCPEGIAQLFCNALGDLIYFLPTGRRFYALSNLHHAFPEKPDSWRRKIARQSCRRVVELAAFAVASPWFSDERYRQTLRITPEARGIMEKFDRSRGLVALIPHFTMIEALGQMPQNFSDEIPKMAAIYRPLDNPAVDQWVKNSRQRFGIILLSRKKDMLKAKTILSEGGCLTILYDQNAGNTGALITLFDRIVSATNLPGIMANKYGSQVVVVYPRRTSFWRADLCFHFMKCDTDPVDITVESNAWLENYLRSSDEACEEWLWSHKRWKNQDVPARRLRLQQKKDFLDACKQYHGWTELPRRTRFWIRLPNWLGDIVMALPLLRVLRNSRPDAEITILVKERYIPLLEKLGIADCLMALPPKGPGYYRHFQKLRHSYPDTWLLFTNSLRGDIEARLAGCPQRFGMLRPGKPRPLLTHAWIMPGDFDETQTHQTRVWEKYLRHFGLDGEPDFEPFTWPGDPVDGPSPIGLICGTENDPEKRWPIEYWRALIQRLIREQPETHILLFGTSRDISTTSEVAEGFPKEQVIDLAGKTSLLELAGKLAACRVVVCNDTGGMHLANALGTPVAALFGPTNPIRTGPIFKAPLQIIQPAGCPATGGLPIDKVQPETVWEELSVLLTTSGNPAAKV